MIVTRPVMTLAFAIGALISTAAAFDNSQWNDVPDHVRSSSICMRGIDGGLVAGVLG